MRLVWVVCRNAAVAVVAVIAVGGLLGACEGTSPPQDTGATEAVWCADDDGVVDTVTYPGHDGDLTALDVQIIELSSGDTSDEELLEACSRPWRWLATDTLCEAYAPVGAVQRVAAQDRINAVHGDAGGHRPGFPVVIRGDVACEEVVLEVGRPADHLRSWDATEAFNLARRVEFDLAEATDHGCLGVADARALALQAREELSGDWPVLESTGGAEHDEHAGLCFDVRLDRSGFLHVDYAQLQRPASPDGGKGIGEP